jgi:hypothetical protein
MQVGSTWRKHRAVRVINVRMPKTLGVALKTVVTEIAIISRLRCISREIVAARIAAGGLRSAAIQ